MTLDPLPSAIDSITRSKPLSVTSLASFDQCMLKVALTASDFESLLPQSPFAVLGTLIHHGLEKGLTQEEVLREALAPSTKVTSIVAREGAISLLDAVGKATIRVRIARMPLRKEGGLSSSHFGSHEARSEYRISGFGGELVGIIDHVRWGDDDITITDFKTGPIRDEGGDVKGAYRLQLMAYGSLLREAGDSRPVRLRLIGTDGLFDFWLEESHSARVRDLTTRGVTQLPRRVARAAEALAAPGSHCLGCGFRPRCATYLQSAPRRWQQDGLAASGLTADVWGIVEGAERLEEKWLVRMRDAAHRRVSVFGVPDHFFEQPPAEGVGMYFFGIRALRSSMSETVRNFEIVARKPHLSAHDAAVFIDPA